MTIQVSSPDGLAIKMRVAYFAIYKLMVENEKYTPSKFIILRIGISNLERLYGKMI